MIGAMWRARGCPTSLNGTQRRCSSHTRTSAVEGKPAAVTVRIQPILILTVTPQRETLGCNHNLPEIASLPWLVTHSGQCRAVEREARENHDALPFADRTRRGLRHGDGCRRAGATEDAFQGDRAQ